MDNIQGYVQVDRMPPEWLNPPGLTALRTELIEGAWFNSDLGEEGKFSLPVLSHPLYHQIFYCEMMHSWANQAMEQKWEAIERMIDENRVSSLIWLYERPYRANFVHSLWEWTYQDEYDDYSQLPGFNSYGEHLQERAWKAWEIQREETPNKIWELARNGWTDNENIWQEVDKWEDLWRDLSDGELWMGEDNQKRFAELPKTMEVWRGECQDGGWSYSLDQAIGEFFARRPYNESTGEVVHLEVPKDLVFAFLGDRGEEEVILLEEDLTEYELERYSVRAA